MSSNELRRQSKQVKTLCAACQERQAKFRYRGEVRADRDHTLCFECQLGEINRARARRLMEAVTAPRTWPPFGRPLRPVSGRLSCGRGGRQRVHEIGSSPVRTFGWLRMLVK